MKNSEIFNSFDLVVPISEGTINDQLSHLQKMNVVHRDLIIKMTWDETTQKDVYTLCDSESELPKNPDGSVDSLEVDGYLDGKMRVSINIEHSGTVALLLLRFDSGKFGYYKGTGRHAVWTVVEMANWAFAISVNLDLAKLEKDDIDNKIKVPDSAKKQLHAFQDFYFTVNHLFMDFENTNLINFDPTKTSVGSCGDDVLKQFVFFMQEYLAKMKAGAESGGNPYVLGYAMTATDKTNYASYGGLPDMLKPVGTTFNVYKHPTEENLNTVNYCLVTKGGKGTVPGTPGNFDEPWISKDMQCDARMVWSHSVLIEEYFLKPVFQQIRNDIHRKITTKTDDNENPLYVDAGNDYNDAKKVTATGFTYNISDKRDGKNQYANSYSVALVNNNDEVDINFNGSLYFRKEIDKDIICTAEAWAWANISWSGTVTFKAEKDAKTGHPTIKIQNNFSSTLGDHGTDKNSCAEAWEWIGRILGAILDAFTLGFDHGFFSNLFAAAFSVDVGSVGNIGVVMGNLGQTVAAVLLLPAGNVFFIKNPAADIDANLYLDLTYKSES